MQRVGVNKTLGSVHRTNRGGNAVMLDGAGSYMYNKITGKVTPIEYEDGQYIFHIWVRKDSAAAQADTDIILKGNKFAALAVEEDRSGFARRG